METEEGDEKIVQPEECPMHGGSVDDCDEPCCEYTTCSKFVN